MPSSTVRPIYCTMHLILLGHVATADNLADFDPDNVFAFDAVALAEGFGLFLAHVAAADFGSPVAGVVRLVGDFDFPFGLDEMEGGLFIVDAEADAGVTPEVFSLDGFVPGREDDVFAVEDEPDGGDVGTAVCPDGGDGGGPGLFHYKIAAFLGGHFFHAVSPKQSADLIFSLMVVSELRLSK
jgi:hypothetical protein